MVFSIFITSSEADISVVRKHQNMNQAVDSILEEYDGKDYNIAIWVDGAQKEAEVILLDDTFENEIRITIKQTKEKEEKSDALLL